MKQYRKWLKKRKESRYLTKQKWIWANPIIQLAFLEFTNKEEGRISEDIKSRDDKDNINNNKEEEKVGEKEEKGEKNGEEKKSQKENEEEKKY